MRRNQKSLKEKTMNSQYLLTPEESKARREANAALTIYDFEKRDAPDGWGCPYGLTVLKGFFPEGSVTQAKGQSVYATPIGKVVVTCRKIVLLSTKRTRKAEEWLAQNNLPAVWE